MSGHLEFDLRRNKDGGYSGGVVLRDDKGSVSFVSGNSVDVQHRRYVIVEYDGFRLLFDRVDLTDPCHVGTEILTKESPIFEWYMAAIRGLLGKLGPIEFLGLIGAVHANGKAEGDASARAEIRRALGIEGNS